MVQVLDSIGGNVQPDVAGSNANDGDVTPLLCVEPSPPLWSLTPNCQLGRRLETPLACPPPDLGDGSPLCPLFDETSMLHGGFT